MRLLTGFEWTNPNLDPGNPERARELYMETFLANYVIGQPVNGLKYRQPIYRFFDEEMHADSFVEGKDVRLTTLEKCRQYEDPVQGDPEEGIHTYMIDMAMSTPEGMPGIPGSDRAFKMLMGHVPPADSTRITRSRVSSVCCDSYILCFSQNCDRTKHGEKIGPYCVEISDPYLFMWHVVQAYVRVKGLHDIRDAVGGTVDYASREYRLYEPMPEPLGFVKSPDPWAPQQEVRLLIQPEVITGLVPFNLELPGIAGLCKRIS